ncbi:MAG: hypothetical protein IPF76_12095 [Sphingopyxis sp.]|nr:hypothetical protein [Sphingopyxis sp.]MBK6413740.1 hypothetical protein [Sphingopyxis sp.]
MSPSTFTAASRDKKLCPSSDTPISASITAACTPRTSIPSTSILSRVTSRIGTTPPAVLALPPIGRSSTLMPIASASSRVSATIDAPLSTNMRMFRPSISVSA